MRKNELFIISGASGTLGSSLIELLKQKRHKIIFISETIQKFAITDEIIYLSLSIFKSKSKRKIVEEINIFCETNDFSRVNVINTIGLYELDDKQFSKLEELNKVNAFLLLELVELAKPIYHKLKNGSLISISTNLTERSSPGKSSYIASKRLMESLIIELSVELGKDEINCIAISPGYFPSKMNNFGQFVNEEIILKNQCISEIQTADKIAQLIYEISSKSFKSITGQKILVDFGNTINF